MRAGLPIRGRRCIRARRALSAALDGEASATEVVAAASHLGGCRRCRQFAAQVADFTRELGSVQLDRTNSPS